MDLNDFDPEFLDDLLNDDSGLFDAPVKPRPITTEDRLERAFIEILEFYDAHKRIPSADTMDIAERKLGARLVGIRGNEEKKEKLKHLDDVGILEPQPVGDLDSILNGDLGDGLDDILGLGDSTADSLYDTSLLPKKSPKAPESVAKRKKARNFQDYADLFKQKHAELSSGAATMVEFTGESNIREGRFFLLKGALAFVAEVYEPEPNAPLTSNNGQPQVRLHVIFENGTESKMYRSSLSKRLYEENGKTIASTRSIDASEIGDADEESGYLYVLKSLSTHPDISSLSDLYKIGFTTTSVEKRIAGAEKSSTYLYAPVEIVASYHLFNMRPSVLEHIIHTVFARARLDIASLSIDGAGNGPESRNITEWFIAPLPIIDEAIQMVPTGEIVDYYYDPAIQELRGQED